MIPRAHETVAVEMETEEPSDVKFSEAVNLYALALPSVAIASLVVAQK